MERHYIKVNNHERFLYIDDILICGVKNKHLNYESQNLIRE